jgi:adenylate cyclase
MANKLVLVIEDERPNARLLSLLVERCGVGAAIAHDGKEGLEMIRALRPDLVLLDMVMPIMRGEELLSILRADPELRQVPVIIISTLESLDTGEASELPHLRKPFEPLEVMRMIRQALSLEEKGTSE